MAKLSKRDEFLLAWAGLICFSGAVALFSWRAGLALLLVLLGVAAWVRLNKDDEGDA